MPHRSNSRRRLYDFGGRHSSGGGGNNYPPSALVTVGTGSTVTFPTGSYRSLLVMFVSQTSGYIPPGYWTLRANRSNTGVYQYAVSSTTPGSDPLTNLPSDAAWICLGTSASVMDGGTGTTGASAAPLTMSFSLNSYRNDIVMVGYGLPASQVITVPGTLTPFTQQTGSSGVTIGGGYLLSTTSPIAAQDASIPSSAFWTSMALAIA